MKTRGHLRLVHSRLDSEEPWELMDDSLPHQIRIVRHPDADETGMGIAVSCSCRKVDDDIYEPFDELVTTSSNVRKIWMKHFS